MLIVRALSVFALAAATVRADGQSIVGAINEIKSDAKSLGDQVTAYRGGILGVIPIAVDSLRLFASLHAGTSTADDSAPLSQAEAITLASSVQGLAGTVNATLEAIIAAKPRFDKLLVVNPIVFLNLRQQSRAAKDFGASVTAKVPAEMQQISAALVKPIDDGFAKALDVYHIYL
ncbi:hypothetical protein DCS_08050 [Drechmeria coniospora]|uniref:Antigenic cell wall galactomannoprotein n=1 Tax=Drechmeria coniospora TaxID=98403 RepID=A0A151GG75_DRECN|nr:hypothetical protein DCS_08050 [Drechmeria coniospora]KYK56084.1 hypothetical protein DCS_08050 [Drechmeria coniospora]ODA77764.1 hypothetical protein RJ55_06366 [Drechmeria coniospora]